MSKLFYIAFVLTVCCVSLGSALQCYSCVNCKDDLADAITQTCSASENICQKLTDSDGVTRGCYTKDAKFVGTCKKNGDIEQCICDGDFCNSADSLSVKFSIISSMLIYLLLIR